MLLLLLSFSFFNVFLTLRSTYWSRLCWIIKCFSLVIWLAFLQAVLSTFGYYESLRMFLRIDSSNVWGILCVIVIAWAKSELVLLCVICLAALSVLRNVTRKLRLINFNIFFKRSTTVDYFLIVTIFNYLSLFSAD